MALLSGEERVLAGLVLLLLLLLQARQRPFES